MKIVRALCGPFFVFAGVMHFIRPDFYLEMMPPWLPAHGFMNAASGVAEIAGGLGLLWTDGRIRKAGGWWTIATLIAIFPANIHMALNAGDYPDIPEAALWARLPFQAVFVAWVVAAMNRGERGREA